MVGAGCPLGVWRARGRGGGSGYHGGAGSADGDAYCRQAGSCWLLRSRHPRGLAGWLCRRTGTVWLVQPGVSTTPGRGFAIIARGSSGKRLLHAGGAPSRQSCRTTVACGVRRGGHRRMARREQHQRSKGVSQVIALRCTLGGCGARHVLASWEWKLNCASSGFPGSGTLAQPGVVSGHGHAVAVFVRYVAQVPEMAWAQSDGARIGPVHTFLSGRVAVSGQPDPTVVSEAGGHVLAAWLDGPAAERAADPLVLGLDWSEWSPQAGFGRWQQLRGASGTYRVPLFPRRRRAAPPWAWVQGSNETHPGLAAEPIRYPAMAWTEDSRAPSRCTAHDAFGLSLATGRRCRCVGICKR